MNAVVNGRLITMAMYIFVLITNQADPVMWVYIIKTITYDVIKNNDVTIIMSSSQNTGY